MRIGITAEWIGTQAGGPERYLVNLITEMSRLEPRQQFEAYVCAEPPTEWARSLGSNVTVRRVANSRWSAIPFGIPRELLRHPVDLLHAGYVAPPYCPAPFVLTIHDLGFITRPEFFPPMLRRRLRWLTSWGVRRARSFIANSEETGRVLQEIYGVDPARVTVTPLGVDGCFAQAATPSDPDARARAGVPDRYLLYVGKLQARKNTARLVRAYSKLVETSSAVPDLVLVGRRTWLSEETFAALAESKVQSRIHVTGHVDDADLPAIYRGADLFVFPSLYEGFGLPLLEAMVSGLPVVSSDSATLREVGGDAALYFDPLSEEDIADKIRLMLADGPARAEMVRRGLERARLFSWERTARLTLEAYHRAMP